MCNTKKSVEWGLPLAPYLWELRVGFIQCMGAGIHRVGQFLLQKTVDRGGITNSERKIKTN